MLALRMVLLAALISGCGTQEILATASAKAAGHRCFGTGDQAAIGTRVSDFLRGREGSPSSRVEATAIIFERNPKGHLIDIAFDVSGDGTLTNRDFLTATGDSPRASEDDHRFVYLPDDPRFLEASLFVNANQALDWFEALGYSNEGRRIGIGVHSEIAGSSNNAVYLPADDSDDLSTILVGDGDGVHLQNLATDADVITHMIAHHVVFNTFRGETGGSSVVHEGLADFFTMLQNDDPCYAATICPMDSPTCGEQTSCLRNANNEFKIQDLIQEPPHVRGQVISGLLWDMKKLGEISAQNLARLAYHSLSHLGEEIDEREFVDALKESDQDLFGGVHLQLIHDLAVKRGVLETILRPSTSLFGLNQS